MQDQTTEKLKAKKVFVLELAGAAEKGQEPKVFRLHKERITVGSVVSADVRLSGEGIAPVHAVIELTDGKPRIYDLASETGLFVNGTKQVMADLKDGDAIKVGWHTLKFGMEDLEARKMSPQHFWDVEGGRRLFADPKEDFKPLLLEEDRKVEDIFDWKPASKQALQVVMSWYESVLDVEHFVDEGEVTLGGEHKNDFGIPPLLNNKSHPLVTQTSGNYVCNLDPLMKGVVQRQGKLWTIDELRENAVDGTYGKQIPLKTGDFAKISVGLIDFYLSFTAAPPKLKKRKLFESDPFFLKIFLTDLVTTVLILFGLTQVKVDPTLDVEQVPERIATILYQPEKFQKPPKPPEPVKPAPTDEEKAPPKVEPKPQETVKLEIKPKNQPTPKPVPKEMVVKKSESQNKKAQVADRDQKAGSKNSQNQAKEGAGARAKGAEGKRGSPTAAKSNQGPQDKAFRPSPEGGQGRGGGNSQVVADGNLDILKGATGKIQDLLGNSAEKLGGGGEKLKGFGGFTTQGNGGLALSGGGKGGGGTADTLTGGLSDHGRGGGRVGTGLGAAGTGNGIVGGKSRVALQTGGDAETVVMGAIDPDAIEAAILAHKDEFRLCYEKEINAETGKIAGSVIPDFVIGPSGRVTSAGIHTSSLKNENVANCVVRVIKRIQFPIPKGAGNVQVRYPFRFNPV